MRRLTDQQVDRIARELAGRVGGESTSSPGAAQAGPAVMARPNVMVRPGENDGVFETVDSCVAAARTAFEDLNGLTLAKRVDFIASIRQSMLQAGDELARMAWQETGLGRYEDKVIKNKLVAEKTPGTEALRPETTTGDHGLTLMEWAPFGVIGAITPTTNPTSTIICNVIGMLAAGNSVVFNVHPGAAACSMATVRFLNQAIIMTQLAIRTEGVHDRIANPP